MDRFGLVRGLVCLLLPAINLAAQQPPSGTILGQVVDADQNPLERVEVRLINLSTAKSIVAHTDLAGDFSFSGLSSDRYSLAVHREGYTLRRVGPYEVLPDLPVEVHVALERLAPPLTRPKAGLEGMALEYGLVREQIESVPLLIGSEGRTAVDKLLLLVPGMSPVKSLEVDPLSGQAAAASANGSPRSAINYQLDGASNNAQNRITGAQAATFGPTRKRSIHFAWSPTPTRPVMGATPARWFRPSLAVEALTGMGRRGHFGAPGATTFSRLSTVRPTRSAARSAEAISAARSHSSTASSSLPTVRFGEPMPATAGFRRC